VGGSAGAKVGAAVGRAVGAEVAIGVGTAAGAQALSSTVDNISSDNSLRDMASLLNNEIQLKYPDALKTKDPLSHKQGVVGKLVESVQRLPPPFGEVRGERSVGGRPGFSSG